MIRPLNDLVVIERIEEDTVRPSGLILVDTSQEKSQLGTVLATGPGSILENGDRFPIDVQVGDTVVFSQFGGSEVKLDENTYVVLREQDIYGVIEE